MKTPRLESPSFQIYKHSCRKAFFPKEQHDYSQKMSTSNASVTALINEIARLNSFNQVWNICLIVFGAVGHTLSIYGFTRRPFRANPCARYFLASAFSGSAVVYTLVPLRLLQTGYAVDVFIVSLPICQILSYLFACFR
jgi:hypothetical protein